MLNLSGQETGKYAIIVFLELSPGIFWPEFYFCGSTEALEFAQSNLTPFGKVQKYVEKLEVSSSFSRKILSLLSSNSKGFIDILTELIAGSGFHGSDGLRGAGKITHVSSS